MLNPIKVEYVSPNSQLGEIRRLLSDPIERVVWNGYRWSLSVSVRLSRWI